MEYYYLVNYATERGYATERITRTKPINYFEDLEEIERQLKERYKIHPNIINYTFVGSREVNESKFETMDSKEYLEYLKERVCNWIEEMKNK